MVAKHYLVFYLTMQYALSNNMMSCLKFITVIVHVFTFNFHIQHFTNFYTCKWICCSYAIREVVRRMNALLVFHVPLSAGIIK